MKEYRKNTGFTIIELLIVMTVIAILAGISIFSMDNARSSARDGRRKSDLETIASAVELFKADCGTYPASLLGPGNPLRGTEAPPDACSTSNIYLQEIPGDPQTGNGYCYNRFGGSGVQFEVCALLENVPPTSNPCSACDSGGPLGNYTVTNP